MFDLSFFSCCRCLKPSAFISLCSVLSPQAAPLSWHRNVICGSCALKSDGAGATQQMYGKSNLSHQVFCHCINRWQVRYHKPLSWHVEEKWLFSYTHKNRQYDIVSFIISDMTRTQISQNHCNDLLWKRHVLYCYLSSVVMPLSCHLSSSHLFLTCMST